MEFKEAVIKAVELFEAAKTLHEQATALKSDALQTIEKAQEKIKQSEDILVEIAKREEAVKNVEDILSMKERNAIQAEKNAKEEKSLTERLAAFNTLESQEKDKIASEWRSIQSAKEALEKAQIDLEAEKKNYKDKVLDEVRQKLG